MLDDSRGPVDPATDPISVEPRVAGLEPVRRRRADGAVHESSGLGRLHFSWMPAGRPSYWQGWLPSDQPFGLRVVCEVEQDELPGADHAACVVAVRRRAAKDAAAVLPLVQARLRAMRMNLPLAAQDLSLTGVRLPPRPMIAARQLIEYRTRLAPELLFTAVFLHGAPRAVHVDRDF